MGTPTSNLGRSRGLRGRENALGIRLVAARFRFPACVEAPGLHCAKRRFPAEVWSVSGKLEVLVFSGERETSRRLESMLRKIDAQVSLAMNGPDVTSIAKERPLRVALIDTRNAPDPVGLMRYLHRHTSAAVFMLTKQGCDRVGEYLELGADDCLSIPVTSRELIARIRRRIAGSSNGSSKGASNRSEPMQLDPAHRMVTLDGRTIELADREYDLLAFMASHPGVPHTADELLAAVWESTRDWQTIGTIREHIYRLRKKLETDPRRPNLIVTVRGRGYLLKL